jgi:predicted amidohydrolase YtcJ
MIKPGMLVDLTMIDRDLRSISPVEIRHARIMWPIVGGTTVFKRQ